MATDRTGRLGMPSIDIDFQKYKDLTEFGAERGLTAEQLANEILDRELKRLKHEQGKKTKRRRK